MPKYYQVATLDFSDQTVEYLSFVILESLKFEIDDYVGK